MKDDILLVIVPGLTGGREDWDYLINQIERAGRPLGGPEEPVLGQPPPIALPESWRETLEPLQGKRLHRLFFDYPRGLFATEKARALAIRLNALIHQRWVAEGGFSAVYLLGHSLGGMIARQAYLFGLGKDPTASEALPWAENVTRIVLFAAINRGVDPSARWFVWLFSRLTLWFNALNRLLLADALRGSDFLCNLRLEWIRQFSNDDLPLEVIQVLGDRDCYVRREDSLDVEQFRNGYLLTIPDAGHDDLHKIVVAPDPQGRLALLAVALFGPLHRFAENRQIRQPFPEQVIFLVHGIRASNADWPVRVEQDIKARGGNAPAVEIRKPSYGYFSALRFTLPYTRRKNLGWFKDAYSQYLAANPKAAVHFIGHSNGTYLLGHSLTAVPGIQLKRVALVGSVLPSEYDWVTPLNRQQVEWVRNERARDDVPVGYLCSGLRGLRMKDVGTGGVNGFYQDDPRKAELFWYHGGHGAVFDDPNACDSLAAYVLGQIGPADYVNHTQPANKSADGPKWFAAFMSRTARIHFRAILMVLILWLWYLFSLLFDCPSPGQVWQLIQSSEDGQQIVANLFGMAVLIGVLDYL